MATAKRKAGERTTKQARKLVLFGATDEQIAWFFDIDILTLAEWAKENEEFFRAITPSESDYRAYQAAVDARRAKRRRSRSRRLAANPTDRLVDAMRSRLWAVLKGRRSDGRLFSRLGFTKEELVAHLEARFQSGMTWANYGQWHVDHVKPCAAFDHGDSEQFAECWSLRNLQPLWKTDNIKKGARYVGA